MTKKGVFLRKLHRAFKNKENIEFSKFKGYPNGTYFGYHSFKELRVSKLKEFTDFYGDGLRKLKFKYL